MKRLLWFFAGIALWGCSDGDLDVSTIDFDDVTLSSCETDISATVFFKLKQDESLILTIPENLLQNAVDTLFFDIPSQSQFYYRFFDGTVSSNYFCDAIPPSTPLVEKEIEATGGTLVIITTEDDLVPGTFHHTFTIEDLILTNENDEQLIDVEFELGVFTTSQ